MLTQRDAAWQTLERPVDVLVIGGGVTGAAVLLEAARRGLRSALVERGDFACATSSRSSKLVHGGLRYLKEGKLALTRESVREREALLREAPGLVDPMPFVMAHYRGRSPSRTTMALGLALYDAIGGSWRHRYIDRDQTVALVPPIAREQLTGAHCYRDATTDDARLVLRLISEACDAGAVALNYVTATPWIEGGAVRGANVSDAAGNQRQCAAAAVISATGVFADELRGALGAAPRLRPLRGSHLVLPDWRLPLACAVAFEHPDDGRPVFAYPWLERTLVGTTDLDYTGNLDDEPAIARDEMSYLLAALAHAFPTSAIGRDDVVATYAGIRPVIDAGRDGAPSRASRDHAVWNERGLVTITGGKLTTFRPMALDALAAAAPQLPPFDRAIRPIFERPGEPPNGAVPLRLRGRYGRDASVLLDGATPDELEPIGSTPFLWAELRWAARHELVEHLDDLLLRRTRIGLLLTNGGERYLDRIGALCREELGWSDGRWALELDDYRQRWRNHYGVPHG